MTTARKKLKKKISKRREKSAKVTSAVVTVRISDEEKERFDGVMRNLNVKHYSDAMRMALHMVHFQQLSVC